MRVQKQWWDAVTGAKYGGFPVSAQKMRDLGYTDVPPVIPEAIVTPKKYSKLAIIRALGDGWAAKRAELEASGLLDQFFAADYLLETDEVFAGVLATLTEEQKTMLDAQCQWSAE